MQELYTCTDKNQSLCDLELCLMKNFRNVHHVDILRSSWTKSPVSDENSNFTEYVRYLHF